MRNVKLVPYVLMTTLLVATDLAVASKPSQNAQAIFERACAGRLSSTDTKELFEEAAKLKHADARGALALIYAHGWCGEKTPDAAAALASAEEAANRGSGLGNLVLSRVFADGIVVEPNKERSHSYARLALKQLDPSAAAGNRWSAYALAQIHLGGLAGPPDLDKPMKWMKLAAEKSFEPSLCYLGVVYMMGQPDQQLTPNPALAKRLFERAADQGFDDGQYYLATTYEFGEGGLDKDPARAVELYSKAAKQGHAHAQLHLGFYYEFGESGVTKSATRAVQLYEAAARQGIGEASFKAARLYDDGWPGHPRDIEKANAYFQLAAELGHTEAVHSMVHIHLKGLNGCQKDSGEATKWFRILARDRNFKESDLTYVLFELRNPPRPSTGGEVAGLDFDQILKQVTSSAAYRSILSRYNFKIEQAAVQMASLPAYGRQEEFDAVERRARAAAWQKTLSLVKEKAGTSDISSELANGKVPLFLPSPTF